MPVEIWTAVIVFVLLCVSAGVASAVRPFLPAHHRAHETIEALHLMITMLVTFSALVLGLLIASASDSFKNDQHDRQQYALDLAQLDRCLFDYGPAATPERNLVADYTASVIATTWPDQKRPTGVTYPSLIGMPQVGESVSLTALLNQLELGIRHLTPANAFQAGVLQDCVMDYRTMMTMRRTVIWDDNDSLSFSFYAVLTVWLMIVFAALGLAAPSNRLSQAGILLCAVSLTLAVFMISDLDHPYGGGLFTISSGDMRAALAEMQALGP